MLLLEGKLLSAAEQGLGKAGLCSPEEMRHPEGPREQEWAQSPPPASSVLLSCLPPLQEPQIKSLEHRAQEKFYCPLPPAPLPPDSVKPQTGSSLSLSKGNPKDQEGREPRTYRLLHTIYEETFASPPYPMDPMEAPHEIQVCSAWPGSDPEANPLPPATWN